MNDGERKKRVRVLIVEDNPHMQHLLRHLLQPRFDLEVVQRVNDALEMASRQHFDPLLLDINLGGGQHSSADLLDALRQTAAFDATPAIACTAYARLNDRDHFLARGFDYHIAKPFTREQLYKTIEAALATLPTEWQAAA